MSSALCILTTLASHLWSLSKSKHKRFGPNLCVVQKIQTNILSDKKRKCGSAKGNENGKQLEPNS